jgi:Holliday junction resolvase
MSKRKGTVGEREIIELFWKEGWAAHRIAGSGSNKFPSPDIIAGNAQRKLAIEAKITKDNIKYFDEEEVYGLEAFARVFGAEPWIAVKFAREHWSFFALHDLMRSGKLFKIGQKDALTKGLLFEELIKKEIISSSS